MTQNALLIVYGMLFLGVLLFIQGAVLLVSDGQSGPGAANRRLRMLAAGEDPERVLQNLRRTREKKGLARLPVLGALADLLIQAGVSIPLGAMLGVIGILSLVLVAAARPFAGLPIALVGGPLIAVLGVVIVLRSLRGRRLLKISKQLVDAIELVVRSLKAGQPLNSALRIAAKEIADPLGTEIGLLIDEVTYGKTLPQAAQAMADRIGLEEVQYLVVAIKVQHGTGGNLSEILSALARVIRDRTTMVQRIKAISAEGRMSATVLSAFPVVLGGLIQLTTPKFFGEIVGDPLFGPLIGFIVGMIVVNIVVTRRLVNFDF